MLNNGNGRVGKVGLLPLARALDLVTREMPDEVLVYDLKRHKAHCLNQTAAMVWKYCDGQKTVADIARQIEKNLNTTVDEAFVWLGVERLGKAHLLEERLSPPLGSSRLSRREAIRRLGLGAALAVPVVMSIVAPTAVSAASCVANGQGTNCSMNTTSSACCSMCCQIDVNPDLCLQTGLANGAMCHITNVVNSCECANGMCGGPSMTCCTGC